MKYLAIPLIVLVAFINQSFGQSDQFIIRGKVTDAESNQPVAFASVGLKDSPISTVTNLEGDFNFKIHKSHIKDSIIVSSIGYELKTLRIPTDQCKEISITLQPSEVFLDAITVTDSLNGNEIIKLAVDRLSQNHPNQPTSMEAFYRERQMVDDAYVSLVEAALTVYDQFNIKKRRSPLRTKMRIDQLRRSLVYPHPLNSWWQEDNLLMHALSLNPIPYGFSTLEKALKKGQFIREGSTTVMGKKAYIVTDDNNYWSSTYFIQAGSYAVVRVEHNYDWQVDEPKRSSIQGDTSRLDIHFKQRHTVIDFKQIDNKFYPV